jgi:DNA-binding MarR family transcriptional regulator
MRTGSETLVEKVGTQMTGTDKTSPEKTSTEKTGGEGELAARLRLAVLRLSRQLRQQLVGGVTQSQVSVLSSVERLGAPTLGELAASEKVQPPSMTRQVDGLVAAGLLAREVHPVDRRIVQVRLTPGGERTLQQNRSVRTAFVASRLKRLPADERARLAELVGLLEKLVDQK